MGRSNAPEIGAIDVRFHTANDDRGHPHVVQLDVPACGLVLKSPGIVHGPRIKKFLEYVIVDGTRYNLLAGPQVPGCVRMRTWGVERIAARLCTFWRFSVMEFRQEPGYEPVLRAIGLLSEAP